MAFDSGAFDSGAFYTGAAPPSGFDPEPLGVENVTLTGAEGLQEVTVNVPEDANACVIGGTYYRNPGPPTITVSGTGWFTEQDNLVDGGFDTMSIYAFRGKVTATGTQTLSFNSSAGLNEGPTCQITWLKVQNPDDWELDFQYQLQPAGTPAALTITLNSNAGGLVIAYLGKDSADGSVPPNAPSGTTSLAAQGPANGDYSRVVSVDSPNEGTTTVTMALLSWPTLFGFSVKAGIGGDVTGTLAVTETGDDVFAGAGDVIVQGTLAVTEAGSDTFASSGGVIVQGTLSVAETGADTFAATGTASSAPITGTLAVTETGDDTFAGTGDVIVQGALSVTETGADTFASSGTVLVQGTLSVSETGDDTFAASGSQAIQGTLTVTETGDDTFAGTGDVIVQGALSVSETGDDTFAGAGDVIVQGAMSATEGSPDTLASTGTVLVQGALSVSETGADTFAAAGGPVIQGTLSVSETGADTFAATGVVSTGVFGDLIVTETGADTAAATGTVNAPVLITGAQAMLVQRLAQLHGLLGPLTVSRTAREADGLTQVVAQAGDTVTINTTIAADTLYSDVGQLIEDLAALHGLTGELVVTPTTRVAPGVSQTLQLSGDVTTVTRQ